MHCEKLAWDSDFFAKSIWRGVLSAGDDADFLERKAAALGCDVLYVLCPAEVREQFQPALLRAGARPVGCRLTYQKSVSQAVWPEGVMRIAEATPDLRQLAYASGHLSRFNADEGFRGDFRRLYDRWIDMALEAADGVVLGAFCGQGKLRGMVTTEIVDARKGKIGLLATSAESQGQGVGARLLEACEAYYGAKQIALCEVVTQAHNAPACRLYEKKGYAVAERTDIWHLWRKSEP